VPYYNPAAEVVLESGNRLRRKIDLWNQYQGLILGAEVLFQIVQVDLGFSAAGDAV